MGMRLTKLWPAALIVVATMAVAAPVQALQCVPYARAASGIDLRGDAWRWWSAAEGLYERGHAPRLGAVMVFRKSGKMRLGHVAVVTKVISPRQVLIDHANWGRRHGERGRVAKMVAVRDISPRNDWSAVQVWNAESDDYGLRAYPTYGFIYPRRDSTPVKGTARIDLPNEVAALMADYAAGGGASPAAAGPEPMLMEAVFEQAFTAAAPAVDVPAADAPAADAPAPTVAAPAVTVSSPAPSVQHTAWDGDRAAALKAGSGRY